MAQKICKWCEGNISYIRFVVSWGYCMSCSLKLQDSRATAPTKSGNRGKNVK